MSYYYVSTLTACVILEAVSLTDAERKATFKLSKAIGHEPKIRTCRLATADEIAEHLEDLEFEARCK